MNEEQHKLGQKKEHGYFFLIFSFGTHLMVLPPLSTNWHHNIAGIRLFLLERDHVSICTNDVVLGQLVIVTYIHTSGVFVTASSSR